MVQIQFFPRPSDFFVQDISIPKVKLISAYKVFLAYANAAYIRFSKGDLLACLLMVKILLILSMSQIPSHMCVIVFCIVPQNRGDL